MDFGTSTLSSAKSATHVCTRARICNRDLCKAVDAGVIVNLMVRTHDATATEGRAKEAHPSSEMRTNGHLRRLQVLMHGNHRAPNHVVMTWCAPSKTFLPESRPDSPRRGLAERSHQTCPRGLKGTSASKEATLPGAELQFLTSGRGPCSRTNTSPSSGGAVGSVSEAVSMS